MRTERQSAFVTGATGFIGRHLVEHLVREEWAVAALVRDQGGEPAAARTLPEQVSLVRGDVTDELALAGGGARTDVFFHLAAQASVGKAAQIPGEAIDVNIAGTLNALEYCRANGVRRFVLLSTMRVLDHVTPSGKPSASRLSVYAASKLTAERMALAYGRAAGFEVVIVRSANVYGPGQATDAVVPEFVAKALSGQIIAPAVPGVRRDFLYVDDLVDALIRAGTVPGIDGQTFDLESGHSVSIGELADLVMQAAASKAPAAIANPQPVAGPLGWSPRISIETGIARTVAAAREAAPIPSPQPPTSDTPAPGPTDATRAEGPRVSIIIPVYNGSAYLAGAIDSALAQTYPNIEVLVVNDGSTDDGATAAVAARYWDRIRYLEQENGGVASALNAGIEAMRGELFSWLSHDDVYCPEKVEAQVRRFRESDFPCLIFCDYDYISETGEFLQRIELVPHRLDERPLDGLLAGRFNGCTFLVPRDILIELGGFRTDLPTTQDYELWFRISHRLPFVHVPRALVKQRLHDLQGSRADGHLEEASRLMVHMIDRTPSETMIRYDGSVERFLVRVARDLAASPYVGAAAYARYRARKALLKIPHQVLLKIGAGQLETTLDAVREQATQFVARQWLILTTEAVSVSTLPANVHVRQISVAQAAGSLWEASRLAEAEFICAAACLPDDEELVSAFEALIAGDRAAVAFESRTKDGAEPAWLLRASGQDEPLASNPAAAKRKSVGANRKTDFCTLGLPTLPARSLRALSRPPSSALLDAGFGLLGIRASRRAGVRLIRLVLRRVGLGNVIDVPWYRATYNLPEASTLDVWEDYFARGWRQGREPNSWFQGSFYARQTEDWDGKQAPLLHYVSKGGRAGLLPHPKFASGTPPLSTYTPPQVIPSKRSPAFRDIEPAHAADVLTSEFKPDRPTVLICLHSSGGGTLTHAHELATSLQRHANPLFLFGGANRPLILSNKATHPPQGIAFDPSEMEELARLLKQVGIDHIDVHHAVGFEEPLEALLDRLGMPYDITLVDYYFVAKHPHLAGRDGTFVGDGAPTRSRLRAQPLPLYINASRRIAISRDMARRLRELRPEFAVICAAHWGRPPSERRGVFVPRLWNDETLRVLVFGPVAEHKGWSALVEAAELVRARNLPIEFHVLGASESGKPLPAIRSLIEHGWFAPETLSARIGSIAPHLAWYPAQVPETWCYALNDGMTAGLPIVANAIGALTERCFARPYTWMVQPGTATAEVVDLFDKLRAEAFDMPPSWQPIDGLPPAEPFYFDPYLAPARAAMARRRQLNVRTFRRSDNG